MPRSSYTCLSSGLYVTSCDCQEARVINTGERFPRCPGCSARVNWVLMRRFSTIPPPRPRWTLH